MGKNFLGKVNIIWAYIARHKYLIVTALGILIVGITDENSIRKYIMYRMRLSEVQAELQMYEDNFKRDSLKLRALKSNAKGVERIARERYFMKRPNEDIYVLSTDKRE